MKKFRRFLATPITVLSFIFLLLFMICCLLSSLVGGKSLSDIDKGLDKLGKVLDSAKKKHEEKNK